MPHATSPGLLTLREQRRPSGLRGRGVSFHGSCLDLTFLRREIPAVPSFCAPMDGGSAWLVPQDPSDL